MATEKQVNANRANAQKSTGPRSQDGKSTSRQNARKHGMLEQIVNGEETRTLEKIEESLKRHAASGLRDILLERCALYTLRLRRGREFEEMFLKSLLDPPRYVNIKETEEGKRIRIAKNGPDLSAMISNQFSTPPSKCVHEGHTMRLKLEDIQVMIDTLSRYETTEENRLFKCIQMLNENGWLTE